MSIQNLKTNDEYDGEPCFACKKIIPITSDYKDGVLCSDCQEGWYEHIAHILDPTYDKSKMNNWEDCWARLEKLYCWPKYDINGEVVYGHKQCLNCYTGYVFFNGESFKRCKCGAIVHK